MKFFADYLILLLLLLFLYAFSLFYNLFWCLSKLYSMCVCVCVFTRNKEEKHNEQRTRKSRIYSVKHKLQLFLSSTHQAMQIWIFTFHIRKYDPYKKCIRLHNKYSITKKIKADVYKRIKWKTVWKKFVNSLLLLILLTIKPCICMCVCVCIQYEKKGEKKHTPNRRREKKKEILSRSVIHKKLK